MSGFSPDGYVGKDALQGLNTSAPTDQTELSDYELGLVQKLFSSPNRIPATFFSYLMSYIEQANLTIPISQVAGFSQQTPRRAVLSTQEATTSATYVDLATAGPTLTGLPPGQYLLIVNAFMLTSSASQFALMAPAVNGATPTDDTAAISGDTVQATHAGFTVASLSSDNNTVVAKYRVLGGFTGTFQYRNLVAIKMANL